MPTMPISVTTKYSSTQKSVHCVAKIVTQAKSRVRAVYLDSGFRRNDDEDIGHLNLWTFTKRTCLMLLLYTCLTLPGAAFAATYWVSPTGVASWASCTGSTPLSGTSACSLSTANKNAAAGDMVYLRGGTYSLNSKYEAAINPTHSGSCETYPCIGGTGAARIVFSAAPGETPVLQQANNTNIMMGISLNGVNWIKITGITFSNFTYYLAFIRGGSSYNEISYCQFTSEPDYETGLGIIIGNFSGDVGSVHTWIHHNYLSRKHNTDPCTEAIDMIKVGNNQTNPWAADNHTTIENNYIEYSGHASVVTNSLNNVIRNNICLYEPWITVCTSWQQATSSSSVTIETGSKSFITQAGLGWVAPEPISIVYSGDYSKAMGGLITSYNNSTGAIIVKVTHTGGSGTYDSWILNQGLVPYYVNSSYNGLYGHRNLAIGDENHYVNNLNLIEGNRLGFAGTNPGNGGSSNLDFESPGNIGRYNYVYGGMNSGIYFKWGNTSTWGNGTGGVNNRCYNNTIYHNGYGWNPQLYGGKNLAYNGQGIAQNNSSKVVNTDNVIKNNLVYDNSQGDICSLGWYGNSNCTPASYDIVSNNWVTTNGDPDFLNPDLTDTLSQNLFPSAHGYTTTPLPDLSLKASSKAIDGGTYLTTASGSGNGSTSLVAADAMYFQDGTRGSILARASTALGGTMQADWIAIGSVNNVVQISGINYSTNTITLASPMTWNDNAPIWLYKKSDGAKVLVGAGPDFGASELQTTDDGPPAPPRVYIR